MAKALSRDYGLAETEDLQTNIQQFLKHIGVDLAFRNSASSVRLITSMKKIPGTRVSVVVPEDVPLDLIDQDGQLVEEDIVGSMHETKERQL